MQKSGGGVDIKFNPAMIAQFERGDFKGIVPVITGITPITIPGISLLLGLREDEENEKLAKVWVFIEYSNIPLDFSSIV